VVNATHRPLYPRERYPFDTHRVGGWVGSSAGVDVCGRYRILSGFDPRTVQLVATRYTDWAIAARSKWPTLEMRLCLSQVRRVCGKNCAIVTWIIALRKCAWLVKRANSVRRPVCRIVRLEMEKNIKCENQEDTAATGSMINGLPHWLQGPLCRQWLFTLRKHARFSQKILVVIQFENFNSFCLPLN
jgi:hypothetical protein